MSSDDGTKGIFYLFVAGGFLYIGGFRLWKRTRLMKNTPTSKVRSAAMGHVELAGIAVPHTPQKAPISGTECCWWECEVQELRRSGKSSYWATLLQKRSPDLIYLEDSTGKILINPYGAEFDIGENPVDLNSTRTRMAPVLELWGLNNMNWFGGSRNLRVIEKTIPTSAPLYVIGQLVSSKNTLDNLAERFRVVLQRIKADAARMNEADTNKDGTLDGIEWDAYRKKIETEFYEKERARAAETPEVTMVMAPQEGTFLIATKEEKELTAKADWLAPLMIAGGIGCNCLGVYLAILEGWHPLLIGAFILAILAYSLFARKNTLRLP